MHVHVGFRQSHILSDANFFAVLPCCYSLPCLSGLSRILSGYQRIGTVVYRYMRICLPALYVAYVLYFHTAYIPTCSIPFPPHIPRLPSIPPTPPTHALPQTHTITQFLLPIPLPSLRFPLVPLLDYFPQSTSFTH
ncbi:hypothetical protein L873DRAFT_1221686 [Choiromyces venosus 120613-1]|uniref:Uncharacterized protein n=1 Tax=Choiromyces venosus 120613-1 TaxID=1336337 RepID=A0A3N4JE99_9PEZI|nr:hypothetical protein L873DRAFT_1221686 [Choiromyces venosus 120613-1]